ncbi:MAG: CARDB domain-containing protein [Chitinophagaceae bacterium]
MHARKFICLMIICSLLQNMQAVLAQSPPGNALHLDGVNDHIVIPHNSLLKPANQITIEAWIKVDDIHTNQYYDIYRKEDVNARQIFSFQEYGKVLSFGLNLSGGYYELDANITPAQFEGSWVHVAATYDGTTRKIYRNGELIKSQSTTGLIPTTGTAPGLIGSYLATSEFLKGSVDEFRIWNVARSQALIREGMRNDVSPNSTGLIVYYKFDIGMNGGNNAAHTSILDQTPNGINGTLTNFLLSGNSSNYLESYAMVLPSALSPTNTTLTGFTANWASPPVGTVGNYYLQIATDFNFLNPVAGYELFNAGTTTSYNVTGLFPGQTYYYRIKANKASVNGEGAWTPAVYAPTPASPTAASVISRIEYYLDNDPGLGNATQLSFSPSADVQNVTIAVDPATLTEGVHRLYVRSRDLAGKWGMTNLHTFYKPYAVSNPPPIAPPNITRIEYYLDTDPGYGNGTTVNVTPGVDLADITIPVNASSLTEGVHQLYVRARDVAGNWSMTASHIFYRPYLTEMPPTLGPASDITVVEYYIDNDPGAGNATQLTITPGSDIQDAVISIDPTSLTQGVHRLYVRAKNASGGWSLINSHIFYKPYDHSDQPPVAVPATNITRIEYYIDTDPGLGNATSIGITPGTDIQDAVIAIDPAILTEGVHRLYTRSRDASGKWSMINMHLFYKPYPTAGIPVPAEPAAITRIEYYVDTDPGYGKGTALPFSPSPGLEITDLTLAVDISTLSLGNHTLYIRALDVAGRWSMVNTKPFTKEPPSALYLTLGEINDSLCSGAIVNLPFILNAPFDTNNIFTAQLSNSNGSFASPVNIGTLTGYNSGTITATIPAGTVNGDNYRIRIISTAPLDTSDINLQPIHIRRIPQNTFSISGNTTICFGTENYTVNNPETGALYSWQVSGGGTITPTGATASIIWHTAGTHTITVKVYNYCGDGYTATRTITVNNLVPTQTPVLTNTGRWLYTTAANGLTLRWFRNGVAIANVTTTSYQAVLEGSYSVRYVNSCGEGNASNAISFANPTTGQTISFPAVGVKTFGDAPFVLTATSSSGLPVSYRIVSGSLIATLNGDTVNISRAGSFVIEAIQPGNDTYSPAIAANQTITIARATQTVILDSIPDKIYGIQPVPLSGNSSSGLPVVYEIINGPASIISNSLRVNGAGLVTVKARQAGNINYIAAEAIRIFCVSPVKPDSVTGFRATCLGSQKYKVFAPVPGSSYYWSLPAGGSLSSSGGNEVTITWTQTGTHKLFVSAMANCGAVTEADTLVINVTNLATPEAPVLHLPADGLTITTLPATFFWQASSNASLYDLYIWKDGVAEPTIPLISDIEQVGQVITQSQLPTFASGSTYKWKVIAKNACSQASSTIRSFSIPSLPNLVVSNVQTPPSVFSGKQTEILVSVTNTGQSATPPGRRWRDLVYLSADTVLNLAIDQVIGSALNVSALDPGQSYTSAVRVEIPKQVNGPYHLIVKTDGYDDLDGETSKTDNLAHESLFISLTPPPDLQVVSVVNPGDVFSGGTLNVQYAIANKGTGIAEVRNGWIDAIYISPDPVFDMNGAIRLKTVSRSESLAVDGTYTVNTSVSVPAQVFGTYFIYVVTDLNNALYEYTFENNNVRSSDAVNVFLTPPPDLVVTSFNSPAERVVGYENIPLSWTVRNQGATAPTSYNWHDGIYISTSGVFSTATATLLTSQSVPSGANPLPPDASYNRQMNLELPGNLAAGRYYLHLMTDYANGVFEYQSENNNLAIDSIVISRPDLVATNVEASSVTSSEAVLPVQWTISNQGDGKVLAGRTRLDQVWLSPSNNFNDAAKKLLASVYSQNAIDTGSSLLLQQNVTIPQGLSGNYFLFVRTDASNTFSEENEDNNVSTPFALHINLTASPDLHIDTVIVKAEIINPGQSVAIHYKVTNAGTGDITGKTWQDRIYVSKSPEWNTGTAYLVKTIERIQTLPAAQSYEVNDSVSLSMSVLMSFQGFATNCYFFVFTDAGDKIYEHNAENNNIKRSGSTTALQQWPSDLVMDTATMNTADTVTSGSFATINWNVTNNGFTTSYYGNFWYDGVYISADTVWDDSDIFITDKVIYGPVERDRSYAGQLGFTIPNGLSGSYYILIVADHKNTQQEQIRNNNYTTIRSQINGTPKPIAVSLVPPPDLLIDSFSAPQLAYAGQPIQVSWKVKNNGPGATKNGSWSDRLYFGKTPTSLSTALHTVTRVGNLEKDSTYTVTAEVFVPSTLYGSGYFIIKTDNNNIVYEHGQEQNNLASEPVFIVQPPPADLVTEEVTVPTTVNSGQQVTVTYRMKNSGTHPASGFTKTGFYLSSDELLNAGDQLLAEHDQGISLLPGQDTSLTKTFVVNGINPGSYHVIVRADMMNNILETDEQNNAAASLTTLNVIIPELVMNISTAATLSNASALYYRIEVPESLNGETMMITLKGDSALAANELYVRYDSVPSRVIHDFAYTRALSAGQEIVIASLKPGTYYVMTYGSTRATGGQQPITLLAQKIDFGIHYITAKEGGNTGAVTLLIKGARFENHMTASLRSPAGSNILAQSTRFVNSTTAYATFNLSGQTTGLYDVKLVKQAGTEAMLDDGFKVVTGSGGSVLGGTSGGGGFYCNISNVGVESLLGLDVQHPGATRTRRAFPMTINFGNSGNVDIPVPSRILVSMNGDPVSLTPEGLEENKQEMFLEFAEKDGPLNVLRPGATGSIIIYTKSINRNSLVFRLYE